MKTLFDDNKAFIQYAGRESVYRTHAEKPTHTGFNNFVHKFQTPIPFVKTIGDIRVFSA